MSLENIILTSFLGTHQVAIDLALDRDTATGLDYFLTESFRTGWLRTYHPELIPPPNLNGTSPSDRLISRHFCHHYWQRKDVRRQFIATYHDCRF
jgi:hypothetical protein